VKELLIIGARGFGREVYSLAKESIGYGEEFVIKGFLDDNVSALDGFTGYPKILNSVENYEIQLNDVFVCALGSVLFKKKYASIILKKGGIFLNLISKNVIIGVNSKIGMGCILWGPIGISNDVTIGNFVTINPYTSIGHDVEIGDFIHIGAYCFFGGFTKIENEVTIYVRVTILDRLRIGEGAVIGAASVVIKNVKEKTTVFGNPAKKIEF
jgi:sugar O-acyltransferase (sialic acid O-acetyltransferase NeuD family)